MEVWIFFALCLSLVACSPPLSRQKRSRICYDGMECFQNIPPFDNADGLLPQPPSHIATVFRLFTRNCTTTPEVLHQGDTNTNANCGFDSSLPTKIICHGFLQHGQVKWVQDMAREFLKKKTRITRNCTTTPRVIHEGDTNTQCAFDSSLPTKIICHGFLQHGQVRWVQDTAREFLKKAPMNVITVDWGRGSWFPYSQAVANTRVVGYEIASMLTHLSDNNGLSMDNVHIVGHSLGAHIAGYAGNHVPGIARITGLDPAEPDFKDTATSVHLDKSDANFVDIIHTDGSEFNYDSGFGWIQEVGHIDFYPNGGENQPGCSTHVISGVLTAAYYDGLTDDENELSCSHSRSIRLFNESINSSCSFYGHPCSGLDALDNSQANCLLYAENELSCSHSRSIRLFNESINSPCPFYGHPCSSLEALDNNQANCLRCENNRCPLMGYDADQTQARGKFYLRTRPSGPFCGHTQHVEVEFDHMVPANGDVTVELDGDDQTSDSITISSGERPFVGGDQRRVLFVDREPVDHVLQVRVTFNSTGSGRWLWFGEDHSSVVITKVTVTSAENGRRIHFCEHWATGITNGETVTLTHSSTDPGECPMPGPRHGFFQHRRPSFRQ